MVLCRYARVPEVFHVSDGYNVALANAAGVCQALGARLASVAELQAAQSRGAQWCSCGWTSDGTSRYPMCVEAYEKCKMVDIFSIESMFLLKTLN